MKKFIVAILAIASLNSFAASLEIYETTNFSSQYITGSFDINEDLGRAWVELELPSSFSDSAPDYVRVKVPGLSLVGGSVILDVEGSQTECAKVRAVGIFRYRVARSTGKCVFKSKVVKTIVDDGFDTQTVRKLTVTLETR